MASKTKAPKTKPAKNYKHPESESPMRPEVGTQAQFKKKLPPKTYRYDSSLSPSLDWDGKNPAREQGEALIRQTLDAKTLEEAKVAASKLKAMSKPFLNWAGKAERLSFDVPTLPLFIHERLSTKAILETLKGHRFDRNQETMFDLWGDPQHSVTDQVLRAYEYQDKWVNRMILGDSLVVMNSLLRYEGLGGQVQMIYIDPPYGVRFGSNFQPFIRKRDVSHGDDGDMTREPEMVQAYRDTWELGVHSYLGYLRDRFLLARELLSATGSIFVQISDENMHHVRELMDEVFGSENFVSAVTFAKTTSATSENLASTNDYLLWYARNIDQLKYRQLYLDKEFGGQGASAYTWVELADGTRRQMTNEEKTDPALLPPQARIFAIDNLTSQRPPGDFPVEFRGRVYRPKRGYWKTGEEGMERLKQARRLEPSGDYLRYVRYLTDFPVFPLTNLWPDTSIAGFTSEKLYVVQTTPKVIQRCIQMTTDPGELVFDPTCGGGTTAYCAEQLGRRWITVDTSRVPLALARQRLLTATFPWFELKDEARGPVGGFIYASSGESVGNWRAQC